MSYGPALSSTGLFFVEVVMSCYSNCAGFPHCRCGGLQARLRALNASAIPMAPPVAQLPLRLLPYFDEATFREGFECASAGGECPNETALQNRGFGVWQIVNFMRGYDGGLPYARHP